MDPYDLGFYIEARDFWKALTWPYDLGFYIEARDFWKAPTWG